MKKNLSPISLQPDDVTVDISNEELINRTESIIEVSKVFDIGEQRYRDLHLPPEVCWSIPEGWILAWKSMSSCISRTRGSLPLPWIPGGISAPASERFIVKNIV